MDQVLTVTLTDNGRVTVSGPINNKILAYGMLEAAKDAIRDHIVTNVETTLVPATLPFPRNGHKS